MTIAEHIRYWLDSAEHDWETAENLFTAKKYDWSLFIGHLVLEKILKAVFVQENNNKLPPKTHNLLRLAEQSRIELSEEQEMLLDRVSEFNIETRYPQYKNEFYKKCTSELAEEYFGKIKEMATWLKSRIQPDQS